MAERIFLHVATPKSGTSYLQALLWQNVDLLRRRNLLLPATFETHYGAAKSVTQRINMRRTDIDVASAWETLARESNTWGGDVLICHELFAPATNQQAGQAKDRLRSEELHLVITARALHKQLPSAWQQGVRGGMQLTLEEFGRQVRDQRGRGRWFWSVQDVLAIAGRWGAGIPPERVHIVTVPPDAADPTTLWNRYASVLDLEPTGYVTDVPVPSQNLSLGRVECELLRRIHLQRDSRFPDPKHSGWTRGVLVDEILAQSSGAPLALPAEARTWLNERTDVMVRAIEQRGYDVVGDLADLPEPALAHDVEGTGAITDQEIDDVVNRTVAQLQERLTALVPGSTSLVQPGAASITDILDLLDRIRQASLDGSAWSGGPSHPPPTDGRSPLSPGPT